MDRAFYINDTVPYLLWNYPQRRKNKMSQIYIKEPPTNGKVSLAESQFAWNDNEHIPGSSQDFTGRYGHRVMVEGDSIGLQELCSAVPGRLLQWCSVSSHYSWLHCPNWGPHWHGRRYVAVTMHVVSSVLQEPAVLYSAKISPDLCSSITRTYFISCWETISDSMKMPPYCRLIMSFSLWFAGGESIYGTTFKVSPTPYPHLATPLTKKKVGGVWGHLEFMFD